MASEGDSTHFREEDLQNITQRPRRHLGEAGTPGTSENSLTLAIRQKLKLMEEDMRDIYGTGCIAERDSNHVQLFLLKYKESKELYTRFMATFDDFLAVKGQSGVDESDKRLRLSVRELYFSAGVKAENLKTATSGTSNLDNSTSSSSGFGNRPRAKLPTIELMPFDGQRTLWQRFKDTFESLVIKDPDLLPIDKFHYLTTSLKGSASAVIAHLPLTSDNFIIAWQQLVDYYDNPRILATAYLDKLLSIKPIPMKPTLDQLSCTLNQLTESIAAFQKVDVPDKSDFLLFYLASRCLDKFTKEAFELQQPVNSFPTFEGLICFLRHRCLAGELAVGTPFMSNTSEIRQIKIKPPFPPTRPRRYSKDRVALTVNPSASSHSKFHNTNSTSQIRVQRSQQFKPSYNHPSSSFTKSQPSTLCPACGGNHPILRCSQFSNMSVEQRHNSLKGWKGCFNCLFPSHSTSNCRTRGRCKICQSNSHHSLLHKDYKHEKSPASSSKTTSYSSGTPGPGITTLSATTSHVTHVLLGTAIGSILDLNGTPQQIRFALDSGSQFSFITRFAAEKLGLPMEECNFEITGIGQTPFLGFRGKTFCQLHSLTEPVSVTTHALVVDKITSMLPSAPISKSLRQSFDSYKLADPEFETPRPIDFLLGGDLFANVLTGDIISLHPNKPKLVGTIFGYVVMGRVIDLIEVHQVAALCATSPSRNKSRADLLDDLERLWELEECQPTKLNDPEELACEEHFQQSHYRMPTGRYVVHLPFKGKKPRFPSTHWQALKRLNGIETKLLRNPEIGTLYRQCMQEYLDLGHMTKATTPGNYILPHHGVVKEQGNQKKIRVVFDASAQTPIGSINDFLHVGAKLQNNIVTILMNFRLHQYVFTVDLVKMYRQILISPDDRAYQHILWRARPSDPVEEFELNRLTFGLGPAPFLALRCIKQLLLDEGKAFPLAARAIEEDMYVDDLVTGGSTLSQVVELQRQVVQLLARGEFPLSKWSSNHPALLKIATDNSIVGSQPRAIEDHADQARVKILGLQWDPCTDSFGYEVKPPQPVFTKRAILAAVARIYDPLGLLSPIVIQAKALIQTSWKLNLDWDDPFPLTLRDRWSNFVETLPMLRNLKIPRPIGPTDAAEFDILIFGDASQIAYCAAAYLRIKTSKSVRVHLLFSKAKLAPIKAVSIPRLELCAALLAAGLVKTLSNFLTRLPKSPRLHLFTDSTVVLGWLNSPPFQLKTFVANRVSQILDATSREQWFHVRSEQNPSDLGSRGVTMENFIENSLWFNGPSWATSEPDDWPVRTSCDFNTDLSTLPEVKATPVLVAVQEESPLHQHLTACSSYSKILRIFAWMLRFIKNSRQPSAEARQYGALSAHEIHQGLIVCIKVSQAHGFNHNKIISKTTFLKSLQPLTPFLDNEGVVRIGGRVSLANVPFAIKHPIILPNKSYLSELIIAYYHKILLHPGPSLLLSVIRRKFWVIGARTQIRKYSRNCVTCKRLRGKPFQPIMANLPRERLEGARAFLNVGLDFAGPFLIRDSLRRRALVSKAYMCLFVCLGSKAIHLEAVSSLSTPAFLAALDRFVSRRGIPSLIMSDNGTNFVGAMNTLRQWFDWYRQATVQSAIEDYTSIRNIDWRFTPPHAPHHGGLWEAGVRSAKTLLRSAYGESKFTFEELSTIFCKIEAVLNSRPIQPLSNDPHDCDALTPGHLIIGSSLVGLPEPSLLHLKEAYLDRWKLVRQRTQFFWKRWKTEYLQELQVRSKWRKPQKNIAINDLVLIQGEDTDRLKWPLARVSEIYPGRDGVVRVASVRTSKTTLKRPVTKLILVQEAPVMQNNNTAT